jgi:hypothetical protein
MLPFSLAAVDNGILEHPSDVIDSRRNAKSDSMDVHEVDKMFP